MRARLFTRHGKLGDLDFEIGEEASIGRSKTNTVVLPARAISSEHARIHLDRDRDRYVLEDLGSLNGTELDGVPVRGPEPLGPLHVLTIAGRIELIFQDRELCGRRYGTAAGSVAVPPTGGEPSVGDTQVERAPVLVPKGLGAAAAPPGMGTLVEAAPVVLPTALGGAREPDDAKPPAAVAQGGVEELKVVLELPEDLGSHPLPRVPGENVVGRTEEAEVTIPRATVSRRHAVLRVHDGRVFIRDLESANRTYVDGERLEPGSERELVTGVRLRFGDVEGRLHIGNAGTETSDD